MSFGAIAGAVILGLIVNEFSDLSPWLGRKLVRWSARLRYRDSARAEVRAEELAAVVNDRPGKLFKLGTGIGFASSALAGRLRELVAPGSAGRDEPIPEDSLPAGRRVSLAEDEPSRVVGPYLFPTERFRGEWRRHWIHPAKSLLMVLLLAVLASWAVHRQIKPRYAGWLIAAIVVLAVLAAGYRVLGWLLGRFVITNKRLMASDGVLFRRVAMIPLVRVTDLRYTQSPLGRLLNYGTFELESANRRNRLRAIADLPNPNELYLRLVEEMYEPEAVDARLTTGEEEPPADPASVQREIILQIGALSAQLATLAAAIQRLSPEPDADEQ